MDVPIVPIVPIVLSAEQTTWTDITGRVYKILLNLIKNSIVIRGELNKI